ncbi:MAG: valine--tRNA ligase, partial [Phycisphaerae bacterium]|nr:valine--tRNA ligase [Phycisphaerae bacterium]
LGTRGQDARDTTLGTRGQDARDTTLGTRVPEGRDMCKNITYITVATTRPETMLGDTAVAMNPNDPRAPYLVGKKVRLPIVGREIPIIADEHVVLPDPDSDDEKAKFSTGFLKVTPAHDPDDYQIGLRHELPMINVLAPDGTISHNHGWDDWEEIKNPDVENLIGMDRFEAREAVVEFFRQEKLLENVKDYVHSVGHSYRSHVPIEPYLSDQWYVAVKKPIGNFKFEISDLPALSEAEGNIETEQKDGVTYIAGTDVPVNSLAGLALAPLLDGRVKFIPDRYAKTYQTWLENLRDWPISRQLWWGHQIPVWKNTLPYKEWLEQYHPDQTDTNIAGRVRFKGVECWCTCRDEDGAHVQYFCVPPNNEELELAMEERGWQRDEDVLDTWFSSALWPFSTMGWPEESPEFKKFYPGDVLSTAREIITLWVSRMVMMGQYCCGDIPFSTVFIHAMIQDGQGRKMSKSLGNGVDPLDVIDSHGADAMRYTLVSMTTQTQDVRMPLAMMTLPDGREVNSSPKFDVGRNLCNKLWNAGRFVIGNLLRTPAWDDIRPTEHLADAWILSRLHGAVRDATSALEQYRFNELAERLYHFLWDEFCDWYLEIAKGRIHAGDRTPKAVLAHVLDVTLRLLHPICPFITEAIWENLNAHVPVRGPVHTPAESLLIRAEWPRADGEAIDPPAEAAFELLQDLVRQIRNVRTRHNVPPAEKLTAVAEVIEGTSEADILSDNAATVQTLAGLGELNISFEAVAPPADAAGISAGGVKLYIFGAVDRDAEISRLRKRKETLTKGVQGVQRKLDNHNFIAKAPDDVVEREKARLEEMRRDLNAVEESLKALG